MFLLIKVLLSSEIITNDVVYVLPIDIALEIVGIVFIIMYILGG